MRGYLTAITAILMFSAGMSYSVEQSEYVRRDDCLEALAGSLASRDATMKWYIRVRTPDKFLVLVKENESSVVLWTSPVPRDRVQKWVEEHPLANPRTCPDDIPLEPSHVGSDKCPRLLKVAKDFEGLSVPVLSRGMDVYGAPATVRFEMWNRFVTWLKIDASDDRRLWPLFKALRELDGVDRSCLSPEKKG